MTKIKYKYQSFEFEDFDIHLKTLKNTMQFSDDKDEAKNVGINDTLWPMFGVVWPAGFILANLMEHFDIQDKSILEVGCGVALASHVVSKRRANITVTDYHPESQNLLNENISLNEGSAINFFLSNWGEHNTMLGKFDLIIGSDLLYENTHAKILSKFIDQHAHKECEVLLVSPKRGYQLEFDGEMKKLGFNQTSSVPTNLKNLTMPFDGSVYLYKR